LDLQRGDRVRVRQSLTTRPTWDRTLVIALSYMLASW
jgi:hypothetical protein